MKSWGIARALLLLGVQKPLRILCVRELQASLDDSVRQLLEDQIYALGLQNIYTIEKAAIYTSFGTQFAFEGIRHNVQKIKSYEGIDICWAEEAQSISENSWNVLVPTIRKAGSEIWLSFNPFLEKDATYQRFVVHTPTNSIRIFLNWRDNPWLSEELRQEKDDLFARDPDAYMNVWEGHCVSNLEGAVYANELRDARMEGRICKVPYDSNEGVGAYFDLGRRDLTAIWFIQRVAMQYRALEYYEMGGKDFTFFVKLLQQKPYIYSEIGLPHDGKAKQLGAQHTIEQQLRKHKFSTRVARKLPIATGISAVRSLFGQMWFDEKLCAKGIERLGAYRFGVSDDEFSINPIHDTASHGADALRTFALLQRHGEKELKVLPASEKMAARFLGFRNVSTLGWMR